MKLNIENLGYLDSANVEIGDLTIISGKNNTGKTYINYAIFGFLKNWKNLCNFSLKKEHIDELMNLGYCKIDLRSYEDQISEVLNKAYKKYSKSIYKIFSTEEGSFADFNFTITFDNLKQNYKHEVKSIYASQKQEILRFKKETESHFLEATNLIKGDSFSKIPQSLIKDSINTTLSECFFNLTFKRPFILTSERTGISLFYKELDINKNIFIEKFQNKKSLKNIDFLEILDESIARYAISIRDNIDFTRDYERISKRKSFLLKNRENHKEFIKFFEQILGGKFTVVNNDTIYFLPKMKRDRKQVKLSLFETSSAVKSLLLFDLYIKHWAQNNDFLLIDEPELNLHPENQRLIARLIARLVNKGVKVFLTTHSDIFVREINNLIMLNEINDEKEVKKHKYENIELLSKDKIKVYTNDNHKLEAVLINEYGIQLKSFDEIITDQNESSETIYFNLVDKLETGEILSDEKVKIHV